MPFSIPLAKKSRLFVTAETNEATEIEINSLCPNKEIVTTKHTIPKIGILSLRLAEIASCISEGPGQLRISSNELISAFAVGAFNNSSYGSVTKAIPVTTASETTPTPAVTAIATNTPPTYILATTTPTPFTRATHTPTNTKETATPIPSSIPTNIIRETRTPIPSATPTNTPVNVKRTPTPRPSATPTNIIIKTATPTQTPTPIVTAICGNSQVEATEECDDGNLENGDGCRSICEVEDGYMCNTGNDGTSRCMSTVPGQVSPFQLSKVILDTDTLESPLSAASVQSSESDDTVSVASTDDDYVIPGNLPITVIANEACLAKRQNSGEPTTFFDQLIPIASADPTAKFQEAAYSITLGNNYSYRDITYKANEDSCVVGIANTFETDNAGFNDPQFTNQSYLNAIHFSEAYNYFKTSSGNSKVTVATN